jgi:hypothetical protein
MEPADEATGVRRRKPAAKQEAEENTRKEAAETKTEDGQKLIQQRMVKAPATGPDTVKRGRKAGPQEKNDQDLEAGRNRCKGAGTYEQANHGWHANRNLLQEDRKIKYLVIGW